MLVLANGNYSFFSVSKSSLSNEKSHLQPEEVGFFEVVGPALSEKLYLPHRNLRFAVSSA